MKNALLFPYNTRYWGWTFITLSLIGTIVLMVTQFEPTYLDLKMPALAADTLFSNNRTWFRLIENNIADELFAIIFLLGCIMVGFAKEKKEDEYTALLRLQSLMWSVYFHYSLLILSWLFVYELSFIWVVLGGMFAFWVIFILRFRWVLWKAKNSTLDEQ